MTSTAMTFDTLLYAKKLKQVGFTEEQAEVHTEALVELVHDKLATKQDLKKLEIALRRDMSELEMRLMFKLSAILVVVMGLFSGLLGVFIKLPH